MFGAIYTGLSGLVAYQRGLQQVSDNVTNLNTTGFKGSTVTFLNLVDNGSAGQASLTGDRSGAGGGVELGDVLHDFKAGELRQSDRDLDLAIDGDGFFVLLDGANTLYARTGSFEIDKDGFIVLGGTTYRLATLDATKHPVSLSVDSKRTSAPQATTSVKFADNISSSSTSYSVSDITVYDKDGGKHVWTAAFTKAKASDTSWTVTVTDDKGTTIGTDSLAFNNGTVDPAKNKLSFTDSATGLSVTFDFSQGVTSYSAGDASTLRSASVDGFGVGSISGVTVNDKGQVEIAYTNGQKAELGSVALADFRDPQALDVRSAGLFAEKTDAGRILTSVGEPGAAKIQSKRLEASNVDLSRQFGDLILIQRGFQASSQIVSVANDMIQQLFGIRGQG